MKDKLSNFTNLVCDLNKVNEQIDFIENNRGIKSVEMGRISSGGVNSIIENEAIRTKLLIDDLLHEKVCLLKEKEKIEDCISVLDEKEYMIIELRYFYGFVWHKIGTILGYSSRHCKRLEREAIDKMVGAWVK